MSLVGLLRSIDNGGRPRVRRARTRRKGVPVATVELPTRDGSPGTRVKPELLAPAGDRACLMAAVENGADAVYLGLQRHNARARATNFDGAELGEIMTLLH